jgi:hypothetical protein
VDRATAALRHMMRSGGDDASRRRVLTSLLAFKVMAVTWPGAAGALRTLTNSSGEQAMPLFTGMDALQASATRFGWANPDGSLSFRELPAREALRSALQNKVHFVVIDLGAEHATEFARVEIERVLKPEPDPAAVAARSSRPTRTAQAAGTTAPKHARPLHRIDTPFGVERTTDRTATPSAARVATPITGARAAGAGGGELPELPSWTAVPGPTRARGVRHTAPFDKSQGRASEADEPSTVVGIAPPHPSTSPPELMHKVAADPDVLSLPPLPDSIPPQLPIAPAPTPSRNPPPLPPASAAGGIRGKSTQRQVAAVVSAPRASAGDALADNAIHSATVAAPTPRDRDEHGSGSPVEPVRFTAPQVPLPDAVLSQLSDVLRKYPEVEWACEVSDGSPTPAIGVRIAPSFMARADEIRAGLASVASTSGTALKVSVLTDRDRMREARAEGHAFYPWRRRGKKA